MSTRSGSEPWPPPCTLDVNHYERSQQGSVYMGFIHHKDVLGPWHMLKKNWVACVVNEYLVLVLVTNWTLTAAEHRPLGEINSFRSRFYVAHAKARFQTIQKDAYQRMIANRLQPPFSTIPEQVWRDIQTMCQNLIMVASQNKSIRHFKSAKVFTFGAWIITWCIGFCNLMHTQNLANFENHKLNWDCDSLAIINIVPL